MEREDDAAAQLLGDARQRQAMPAQVADMDDLGADLADPVAHNRVIFAGPVADRVHRLVQAVPPDLAQLAAFEPAEGQFAAVAAQQP